jgi:hypothetical protein
LWKDNNIFDRMKKNTVFKNFKFEVLFHDFDYSVPFFDFSRICFRVDMDKREQVVDSESLCKVFRVLNNETISLTRENTLSSFWKSG